MVLTVDSIKPKAGGVRILLHRSVIGPGGGVLDAGVEHSVPTDLARQLIGRGAADRVDRKAKPEPEAEPNPLEGVDFASDPAAELAIAEGLAKADFDGIDPSSASGFTKPDVQAILELKNGG